MGGRVPLSHIDRRPWRMHSHRCAYPSVSQITGTRITTVNEFHEICEGGVRLAGLGKQFNSEFRIRDFFRTLRPILRGFHTALLKRCCRFPGKCAGENWRRYGREFDVFFTTHGKQIHSDVVYNRSGLRSCRSAT